RQLRVMDLTAITLAMERRIPLVVFNLKTEGNIARVMRGEKVGTKIVPREGGLKERIGELRVQIGDLRLKFRGSRRIFGSCSFARANLKSRMRDLISDRTPAMRVG